MYVEQWLPESSKGDAVDSERLISSNIFADGWIADRSCADIVSRCVTDLVCQEPFCPIDSDKRIGMSSNVHLYADPAHQLSARASLVVRGEPTSCCLFAVTNDGPEINKNSHRHASP